MHRFSRLSILPVVVAVGAVLLTQCGSSNKLHNYQFNERTIATQMLTPPAPIVFSDSFIWIDKDDPIGSVLRIGTTIAKEIEASKVRARLDSAMQQVDIPLLVEDMVAEKGAKVLRCQNIAEPKKADFLLDIDIKKYGIEAESWFATTRFRMEIEVTLVDNAATARIWKKKVKENLKIAPTIFGLGQSINNVVTAAALANLSVDEIAAGLRSLAETAADRIVKKLQQDLYKANEKIRD